MILSNIFRISKTLQDRAVVKRQYRSSKKVKRSFTCWSRQYFVKDRQWTRTGNFLAYFRLI